MLVTDLNNCFVYDKGRYSFSFVIDLTGSKSLNPVPNSRNRTSTCIVMYSLYLYFLGLSLRNTSKALEHFKGQNRSHVAVWEWIQRFGSLQSYNKNRRISAFIINETVIQIGGQHFWLWTCIEPVHRSTGNIHLRGEKYADC